MPSAFLFLLREAVATMTEAEKDEVAELLNPLLNRRRPATGRDALVEDDDGWPAAAQAFVAPSSPMKPAPGRSLSHVSDNPVLFDAGPVVKAAVNDELPVPPPPLHGAPAAVLPPPPPSHHLQDDDSFLALDGEDAWQPSPEPDPKPIITPKLEPRLVQLLSPDQPQAGPAQAVVVDESAIPSPLVVADDPPPPRSSPQPRLPVFGGRERSDSPAPDGSRMRLPHSLQKLIFETALDRLTLVLRFDPETSHSEELKQQHRFIGGARLVCQHWNTFAKPWAQHRGIGLGKKAGKVHGLSARPVDGRSVLDASRRRRVRALYDAGQDNGLLEKMHQFENLHHLELSDATLSRSFLVDLSLKLYNDDPGKLRLRSLVLLSSSEPSPESLELYMLLLELLCELIDTSALEALTLYGSDDACCATLAWLNRLDQPPTNLSALIVHSETAHPLETLRPQLASGVARVHAVLRVRHKTARLSLQSFTALRQLDVTKFNKTSLGGSHSYPPIADYIIHVSPSVDALFFRPEAPLPAGAQIRRIRSFLGPMAWVLQEVVDYQHLFRGIRSLRVFELDMQTFRDDLAPVPDILQDLRKAVDLLSKLGIRVLDRRGRTCDVAVLDREVAAPVRPAATVIAPPRPSFVAASVRPPTMSQPAAAMKLPLEMQRLILLASVERPTLALGHEPDVLEDTVADYRWISRARLVSKDWDKLALPLLFRHTIMAEKGACEALGIDVTAQNLRLLSGRFGGVVRALYDISAPYAPAPRLLQNVHRFANLIHLDVSNTNVVRHWWSRMPPALPKAKLRLKSIVLLSDPPTDGVQLNHSAHGQLLDFLTELTNLACLESLEHEGSNRLCKMTVAWINAWPVLVRALSRLAIRSETCSPLADLRPTIAAKIVRLEASLGRKSNEYKPLQHFVGLESLVLATDQRPSNPRWLLDDAPSTLRTLYFHSADHVQPRHSDIVGVLDDLGALGWGSVKDVGFYALDFPLVLRDYDLLRVVDAAALRRLCTAALTASRSVHVLDKTGQVWDPALVVRRETGPRLTQ